MRVRRCQVLWLEHREVSGFDLSLLLNGGTGVTSTMTWYAHAPQMDDGIGLDADEIALLDAVSPSAWTARADLDREFSAERVRKLLVAGLLIGSGEAWTAQRDADQALRDTAWFGPAALWHAASRWRDVDSPAATSALGLDTAEGLREQHGTPPAAFHARKDATARIVLEQAGQDGFDEWLDARATCRNFDTQATLPLDTLTRLLSRVFAARGQVQATEDFELIKRTSPSGGAMHPTECYLVVQRVAGLASGLYHYNVAAHALDRLPVVEGFDIHAFARTAVAGQYWFADAPVLCIMAPRFARNYWKYRNHAKAYRVCIMDVGHLSQTLQLCATHEGLGSFVTAAINEVGIEEVLGLHGLVDGPLAVCGFGARAASMQTAELDPNHKVWPG